MGIAQNVNTVLFAEYFQKRKIKVGSAVSQGRTMTSTLLKSLLSAGRPTFRHFCSASVPAASTGTTANVEASIPTTTPTASDDSALPPAVSESSDSGVEDKIYSKVDIELRAHQP